MLKIANIEIIMLGENADVQMSLIIVKMLHKVMLRLTHMLMLILMLSKKLMLMTRLTASLDFFTPLGLPLWLPTGN